jgi:hypothetical protein
MRERSADEGYQGGHAKRCNGPAPKSCYNGISVSPGLLRRHPGPLALTGPFESETGGADLPQPNALIMSLIEINLRQFCFVVTFAR